MTKRLVVEKSVLIFSLAFVFNWIWENFHHVLYVHYKGGEITGPILTRAALVDAFYITLVWFLVIHLFSRRDNQYIVAAGTLFLISVGIEVWALDLERWAYGSEMPIIPGLGTGLTPTVQLVITGLASYFGASLEYE